MLFQVALATLDANRTSLLAITDDGEAMTILGNYLDNVTNRDATMPVTSASQQVSNRSQGALGAIVSFSAFLQASNL